MSQQLLTTPSQHGKSFAAFADDAWSLTSNALLGLAGIPLAKVAETAIVSLMRKITRGQLRIMTSSTIYAFPESPTKGEPQAELRVLSDTFWIRLLTMSDLGFSEAFMYGEVECEDLISLFKVFLYNRSNLGGLENSLTAWFFSLPQRLTSYRFLNTISNSRSNISAHYDISNAMFEAFLSDDMTYSCAIFDSLDEDLKSRDDPFPSAAYHSGATSATAASPNRTPVDTTITVSASDIKNILFDPHSTSPYINQDPLYHAQIRKVNHILKRANIRRGDKVLEIGSGWGTLAIQAVQQYGCEVDTLTLSVHQKSLAEERIAKAGLSEQIRVHLVDYRNMPSEWKGTFDRVISVEMIEAVGAEFMDTYWTVVDWALKSDRGVAVVQVITLPEARFAKYIREVDFIRKWVLFPGGFLPTVSLLVESINRGSSGQLLVDSISNIGPHYARTLREWRLRFTERFDSHVIPALKAEHPDVMNGPHGEAEIQVFFRKWIYYFCYCEVGFTTRNLGDHIITLTREGDESYTIV